MAKSSNSHASLGFEPKLWQMADVLRSSMDATIAAIERDNPALKVGCSRTTPTPRSTRRGSAREMKPSS